MAPVGVGHELAVAANCRHSPQAADRPSVRFRLAAMSRSEHDDSHADEAHAHAKEIAGCGRYLVDDPVPQHHDTDVTLNAMRRYLVALSVFLDDCRIGG